SRQGVQDLIKRCDKILTDYEEKLQLVHKFHQTKKMVEEIRQLTKDYQETLDMSLIHRIEQIASDISDL
ncbi:MAG: DNA-binding protein, partial [Hungatella sp.]